MFDSLKALVEQPNFSKAVGITVVWLVTIILVRYLSHWIDAFDKRFLGKHIDTRDLQTLDSLLDYLMIAAAVILSLSIMGLTAALYSMLTAAGVIGIMLGFAIKDVAANFISGIFILIDQPFVVGDSIKVGDYDGAVSHISLRSTQIATSDGPVVSIPNSTMATTPVVNYTVNPTRRLKLAFSIAYGEDIDKALGAIRKTIEAEKRRVQDQEIYVYVSDVREYAVDITALFYAPNTAWFDISMDIRRDVLGELRRQRVTLAVPVRKTFYVGDTPEEWGKSTLDKFE